MTRLKPEDISGIASQLKAYDEELLVKTGRNLRQIACHAAQMAEADVRKAMSGIQVGVVPIRWGQGMIDGFCEATAGILNYLGFNTFVTRQADISGLAEAYENKADVVFLSDDNDFVALNAATRRTVHNADATGKGFAAGLALMARGLVDHKVLVLGCGAVGRSAASALLGYGAKVSLYDIDHANSRKCLSAIAGTGANSPTIEPDFHTALARHSLVVDATDAAEIIRAEDISPQTLIAAPGMPLGVSREAQVKLSDRFLHDPLQIGVATMGMEIIKPMI